MAIDNEANLKRLKEMADIHKAMVAKAVCRLCMLNERERREYCKTCEAPKLGME